jgi:hypothetical protein
MPLNDTIKEKDSETLCIKFDDYFELEDRAANVAEEVEIIAKTVAALCRFFYKQTDEVTRATNGAEEGDVIPMSFLSPFFLGKTEGLLAILEMLRGYTKDSWHRAEKLWDAVDDLAKPVKEAT